MSSNKENKRRVFITLTPDEKNYFTKIFELLDYDKIGKIRAELAARFMRDSDLNRDILKEIFLLTSHKDIDFLEKEEFLIILRLIALAQNKIYPFTKNSLERNDPIPRLPKFSFMEKDKLLDKKNLFEITPTIEKYYLKEFKEKKDTQKEYISKLRTLLLWRDKNPKDQNFNERLMESLEPTEQKEFLNHKEFVVGCYMFHLSKRIELPKTLPKFIQDYLGRITIENKLKKNNNQVVENNINQSNINYINNSKQSNEIINNRENQKKIEKTYPSYFNMNIGKTNNQLKNTEMVINKNFEHSKSLVTPNNNILNAQIEDKNSQKKGKEINPTKIKRMNSEKSNNIENPIAFKNLFTKENNEIEKKISSLNEVNIKETQVGSLPTGYAQTLYLNSNKTVQNFENNDYNFLNIYHNNKIKPAMMVHGMNNNLNKNNDFNN